MKEEQQKQHDRELLQQQEIDSAINREPDAVTSQEPDALPEKLAAPKHQPIAPIKMTSHRKEPEPLDVITPPELQQTVAGINNTLRVNELALADRLTDLNTQLETLVEIARQNNESLANIAQKSVEVALGIKAVSQTAELIRKALDEARIADELYHTEHPAEQVIAEAVETIAPAVKKAVEMLNEEHAAKPEGDQAEKSPDV